ncbi:MAG: TRAP transporter substrate-binding protein [Microvirga sp.]|nr:TRAP transporter substrate-binding protein [Microvirga sp.]
MISRRLLLGGAAASGLAAPALAQTRETLNFRLVTSWPRGRAGPGVSAQRIADRINAMANGRLRVELFAAGEIVAPLGILDAISNGTVEMGHTASLYWQGKDPAAGFFTTAPFGLGPIEHQAWIELRDGQALWDELYAPYGVRAFMAGNTGPSMGGWFRRKIESVEDLRGLRIRVQGIGAEVFQRLGATPMSIPAGDLVTSLDRGTIDAVEFLAPSTDYETGLHQHAAHYYAPGFNKPNGASELLISENAWSLLTDDLKTIVRESARAEHTMGLADALAQNAVALDAIMRTGRVSLEAFPADVMRAAQEASNALMDETAASSELAGRIVASYREATAAFRHWSALSSDMARSLLRA